MAGRILITPQKCWREKEITRLALSDVSEVSSTSIGVRVRTAEALPVVALAAPKVLKTSAALHAAEKPAISVIPSEARNLLFFVFI